MKLTIEGTKDEIQRVLCVIGGSEKQEINISTELSPEQLKLAEAGIFAADGGIDWGNTAKALRASLRQERERDNRQANAATGERG